MASERQEREKHIRQRPPRQTDRENSGRNGMAYGSSGRNRSTAETLNQEHLQLIQWFQTVKFRKAILGGVDERDVWKKLNELNTLYDSALKSERARYDAMLKAYADSASASIAEYRQALTAERSRYETLRRSVQGMETLR